MLNPIKSEFHIKDQLILTLTGRLQSNPSHVQSETNKIAGKKNLEATGKSNRGNHRCREIQKLITSHNHVNPTMSTTKSETSRQQFRRATTATIQNRSKINRRPWTTSLCRRLAVNHHKILIQTRNHPASSLWSCKRRFEVALTKTTPTKSPPCCTASWFRYLLLLFFRFLLVIVLISYLLWPLILLFLGDCDHDIGFVWCWNWWGLFLRKKMGLFFFVVFKKEFEKNWEFKRETRLLM